MTLWTAIVPLKRNGETKSRLAGRLPYEQRIALADRMALAVIDALDRAACIAEIRVLSPFRWPEAGALWEMDSGSGLNAELGRVRAALMERPVLILHGDLPFVTPTDIEEICARSAEARIALAPDRSEIGTNAIALAAHRAMPFAFGPCSFGRHLAAAGKECAVVRTKGLATDIDHPGDIDLLDEAWRREF